MFSLFQIGAVEVLSLLLVASVLGAVSLFNPAAWRWLGVLTCILILAMICTPADPLSMWLVAMPIGAVFAAGVILSPYLRKPATSRSPG